MVHIPESAVLSQKAVTKTLLGWTDERLQRLFENRPDLYIGKIPTWATVAKRFVLANGALTAVLLADDSVRAIVEVCRLPPCPPTIAEIQYRVGGNVDDAVLRDAIARMEELGLGLLFEERVYVVEYLWSNPYPAGLGPPIAKLLEYRTSAELKGILEKLKSAGFTVTSGTKPEMISTIKSCLSSLSAVLKIVENGPKGTMDLLEVLVADGDPSVRDFSRYFSDDRNSATRYLASYGVIGPNIKYSDLYVLPMEIGLAFRGGRPYIQGVIEPPAVVYAPVESTKIDSSAASVAEALVSDLALLLRAIEADRLEPLKSGGIRIKDLRRLAKRIGRTEGDTSRLLGVAWFAGLVGRTGDNFFCPTTFYDSWESSSTSQRWAAIVGTWLASGPGIGLVGMTDAAGKAIPPLFELSYSETLDYVFNACLERLVEVGPHRAIDIGSLDSYLDWRVPLVRRLGGEAFLSPSVPLFNAARLLGVVAEGALSSFGYLAMSQDMTQAIERISSFLPKPTSSFLLGSDLTAVVDGSLAADIRGFLEQIADLESTGAVSLYRFSEASIRRALDAGYDGDEISKFLETYGSKGLPQTLAYLIKDITRRYGSIRVGEASSYLNIADPALAAEVLRNRKLARLRLRALGPNVVVSPFGLSDVMDELRSSGYLPVAESGEGINLKETRKKTRTHREPHLRIVDATTADLESIRQFIFDLRSDDPTQFLSAAEKPLSTRGSLFRGRRAYSIFDDDDEDDDELLEELERLWKDPDGFEG